MKEFQRNVCFSFFESYLEQAIEVKNNMGVEMAYNYLIALIEYALYQKESSDKIVKMLVCGLKNTIDANQDKRAQGFSRENTGQTTAILEYRESHPEATQREIADAINCSVGKVNKVLSKSPNDNNNDNNNSNNNSVSVNMNTPSPEKGKKNRWLEDLTDVELESIIDDYKKRVSYTDTKQRLKLGFNITKETHKEAQGVLEERQKKENRIRIVDSIEAASDEEISMLGTLFHCEKNEVADKLQMIDKDVPYVIKWIPKYNNGNLDWYSMYKNDKDMKCYKTYDDFMKMVFRENPLVCVQDRV